MSQILSPIKLTLYLMAFSVHFSFNENIFLYRNKNHFAFCVLKNSCGELGKANFFSSIPVSESVFAVS